MTTTLAAMKQAQKKSEYRYVRRNSKGEPVFRRDTNETLEFVCEYLKSRSIPYEVKDRARMLWIQLDNGIFSYYYTTGRWARLSVGYPKHHYHSRGIEAFLTQVTRNDLEDREIENVNNNSLQESKGP